MSSNQASRVNWSNLEAFIFDMDGVITNTANIHAAAWKQMFDEYLGKRSSELGEPFSAFDADVDYHRYVDGKPRYDGVKSFLDSRGISLPLGSPDDTPDKETVCGLGNRKNGYFLERLRRVGAQAYPSSIEFIKKLKAKGIPTAVISSSRNCAVVLESAGVGNLFETKVDGVDLHELGLRGKPAPDIFLEAAKRLKVKPERAVVVEDALAGVEAGRRGNFGLVIGVDRANQSAELKKHGADMVVHDLAELRFGEASTGSDPEAAATSLRDLPSALTKKTFRRLREHKLVIFLDYDGTLTPIVEDPAQAILPEKTRDVIRQLARHWTVAIISGRDLADVRSLVGIDDIVYAGSHGFDIAGPRDSYRNQEPGQRFLPALERAETRLRELLKDIPGARIERKRFTIAVHYRQVRKPHLPEVEQLVNQVLADQPSLRKSLGKKVFEIRPDVDWDKGKALLSLLEAVSISSGDAVPLFIGDDITDEDGFRAIRERGIGIAVGSEERPTAAHYKLKDTDEVREFLEGLVTLAEERVPVGIWTLAYDGFDTAQEGLRETLCTLGNGYFATRGAAPESRADGIHYPGTYVAGCYNRLESEIAGRTIENESLVNMPNWLPLTFQLEGGNWFDVQQADILSYQQKLDLHRGVLTRLIRFSDKQGRRTQLSQRRFVHMAYPHLAGLETTIVAENWSGGINIRSALDGRVANTGVERYRQLNNEHLTAVRSGTASDEIIYLQVETNQSHIRIAQAARTRVFKDGEVMALKPEVVDEPRYIAHEFSVNLEKGKPLTIEKIVALFTSRDHAISESSLEAQESVARAGSFDELLECHVLSWDHLWRRCRITIEDNERTAMALHLHIFHLLQTVSLNTIDLDAGVPPRGLHGEAYRGHILWDELFIFPFLNLRLPDITRALLQYRSRRLPEARWAAKQAGYSGAMYPWQSGSDGREESQRLHLNPRSGRWIPDNSHLQYHINLAIAYNIWLYYQVTGDIDFLSFYGAEMIMEIARFWANIAHHNRSLDRYEIRKVMGPDEYHDAYPDRNEPGIDNNAYTNVMTVWLLCRALEILKLLPADRCEALCDNLALRREELERWDDISRKMRIVFHDDGIISQFEGYDRLKEFDWAGYRKKYGDIQRLDRILEAEGDTPNGYKMSKQADVLMLFYLLSADELRELFNRLDYPFEHETIPRNIDYYLERTCHGSTLSRVVHAWVLSRSQRKPSWHLFKEALESDISDIQGGTTLEGIHLGAMAGTVDLIQRCYTGMETRGDTLWLNPYLPGDLKGMRFNICYRRHWVNLEVTHQRLRVGTRRYDVKPIKVSFRDKIIELKPGDDVEFPL